MAYPCGEKRSFHLERLSVDGWGTVQQPKKEENFTKKAGSTVIIKVVVV